MNCATSCSSDWVESVDEELLEDDEAVEDVVVESLVDDELLASDGGGGGGPCIAMSPRPPWEPPSVPLEPKTCANRSFNSVPWLEVSVPELTCVSTRLEIFDCSSSGVGGVEAEVLLDELVLDDVADDDSEESMDVSALVSAVASVEDTEPDETSDWSCCCRACSGE